MILIATYSDTDKKHDERSWHVRDEYGPKNL
jgi:hypothetical protein